MVAHRQAVLEGIQNGNIVSSGAMHSVGPNPNRDFCSYVDAEAEA